MGEVQDKCGETPSVEGMSLILIWPLALDLPPDALEPDPKKDAARALRRDTIKALKKKGAWKDVDDPLRHLDDGDETTAQAYQEYVYFHRYVQRFLYGFDRKKDDPAPMKILRRDDIRAVDVDFGNDLRVTLDVLRLRLHLFEAGAAVLMTEVGFDRRCPCVPDGPDQYRAVTVNDVLTIANNLRRVYMPYWEGKIAKEIPQQVRWLNKFGRAVKDGKVDTLEAMKAWVPKSDPRSVVSAPVASWWRNLLEGMHIEEDDLCEKLPHWRHISDDRMGTMLWLMLDDPERLTDGQWQRLAYADSAGTDFAYGIGFWRKEEERFFYDRFWSDDKDQSWMKTRYAIAGYHFAMVDKGRAGEWSMSRDVFREHFRRHYAQIGLIVHFQFAALLATSNAVSHAVARYARHGSEADFTKAINALRQRHLNFTHRYWFTGVSNQIQGRDIYDRWQERLGSETMFREVEQELASATGFLDARAQERAAEAGTRLNVIAAVGLILSIALGALGANVLIEEWRKVDSDTATGTLGTAREWGIALLAFAASLGLGGLFLKWVLSEKREGRELLSKVANTLTWTGLAFLVIGVFALALRWTPA